MAGNRDRASGVDPTDELDADLARLMSAYANGDSNAFADLYKHLYPRLLRFHMRSTRRGDLAEDLTQKTFLKIHVARRRYHQGAAVRPWAFAIARNLQRDHFRKNSRSKEHLTEEGVAPETAATAHPAAPGPDHFFRRKLRAALDQLPVGQREVVVLHKLEQLSMAEVAETLDIGISAAKVRAHRAYGTLRKILSEDTDE